MNTLDYDTLKKNGAKLLAERDAYALFRQPKPASRGWKRFTVVLTDVPEGYTKRRVWWLSHFGEHVASDTDSQHLAEHFPDAFEWACREIADDWQATQNPSAVQVQRAGADWSVEVAGETVADGLTNAKAWQIADELSARDMNMEETRRRVAYHVGQR